MSIENTLQRIITPNENFGSPIDMYIRGHSFFYEKDKITVLQGGAVYFDTYYNGLSTELWLKKCGISKISFKASGFGEALFRIVLITDDMNKYTLGTSIKKLGNESEIIFNIDLSEINKNGIVFLEMQSVGESFTITSGEWFTEQKPLRNVNLGISVTHFNRKQYIKKTVERIKSEILDDDYYSEKISFIVVDNSKNITKNECDFDVIKIIPNENTGGSGGFMRGLLYYIDEGNFTHVLFMDDDASCEIESIRRTYSVLSYAIKNNSAVAGSIIIDTHPQILGEKGAKFSDHCKLIFNGLNLTNITDIVNSETMPQQPNYGAWCFFAFPINEVKHMSFPFFVRGDDILFGMMNNFNIITSNGITIYADDFSFKSSPITSYLDTRNHLVNMFLHQVKLTKIIRTYKNFYITALTSHKYGSCNSIRLALKHVLNSSDFWEKNIYMTEVRKKINDISCDEKLNPVDISIMELDYNNDNKKIKSIKKLFRRLTFNGVLLPLKDKMVYQNISYGASKNQIFRYKKIFYYNKYNSTGYVVNVSRVKFLLGFCRLMSDIVLISLSAKRQKVKYDLLVKKVTTESFWRKILMKEKD